jgi:hypothetical protein
LVAESTLFKNFAHLGEIQTSKWTALPRKRIQRYDVVNRIETPWWQFQSFSNICSLSKKIWSMVSFYLSEPNQNQKILNGFHQKNIIKIKSITVYLTLISSEQLFYLIVESYC